MRNAEIAATGLALLPFLGGGQTHLQGEYKENVKNGLQYLLRAMDADGSLWQEGGTMYGHGLAFDRAVRGLWHDARSEAA